VVRKVDDTEHIATAQCMKADGHVAMGLGISSGTLYRYFAEGAARFARQVHRVDNRVVQRIDSPWREVRRSLEADTILRIIVCRSARVDDVRTVPLAYSVRCCYSYLSAASTSSPLVLILNGLEDSRKVLDLIELILLVGRQSFSS
jgi:hypothetical protein